MSIEIDVLNGDASWPLVEPLFKAVWPPDVIAKLPWGRFAFAYPEWRVLVRADPEGVVSHVGIQRREITWNGRKMRAGGIGGVLTREDSRRRGYASVALNAAIQTLKDEGATDFALLFCDQPEGRIRFQATAPYVYKLKRAPLGGVIDLCGQPW
jgi:aminoglycoside 2'-N-acetyltransferase I